MIAYASRTGTRRNLAALRAAGWRLLVSAAGVWRTEGFAWAADNGQWSERDNPGPFNAERFERFVAWCISQPVLPDWIVLPDIVLGGARSLNLSIAWLKKLRRAGILKKTRVLIAVQNGMERAPQLERIIKHLGDRVGIFVGGDTDWKLATMRFWARIARAAGAICHVGRVNTARRIQLCEVAGVDSFDGSSVSRFAVTLAPLERARQQTDLEGYLERMTA